MNITTFSRELVKKVKPDREFSASTLIAFFKILREGLDNKDPLSLLVGAWIYENITSEKVRKRKVTAREFEDFLADTFDGLVMDNEARKNLNVTLVVPIEDATIRQYVISNRREKTDVVFSKYPLTVKTTVPSNSEINMGSFAREALFKGFLTAKEYGGERKSGLGSKPQLLNKFKLIEKRKLWPEFVKRFSLMVNNIFCDDLLYFVKSDLRAEIYIIKGPIFTAALIGLAKKGPEALMECLNRYEGNSLRIDSSLIKKLSTKIVLDFTDIENSELFKNKVSVVSVGDMLYGILFGLEENTKENREKIMKAVNELLSGR